MGNKDIFTMLSSFVFDAFFSTRLCVDNIVYWYSRPIFFKITIKKIFDNVKKKHNFHHNQQFYPNNILANSGGYLDTKETVVPGESMLNMKHIRKNIRHQDKNQGKYYMYIYAGRHSCSIYSTFKV